MKNFPGRFGLWLLLLGSRGCAPQLGPVPQMESPAGQWIDLAKTLPSDTMVWVLSPGGSDGLLRIALERDPEGGFKRVERRQHYGHWSLSQDGAGLPMLCFNKRPGRQPPSCSSFHIDTLPADSGGQRRLIVRGYQGRHHAGDRVLIERRR